MSEHGEKLQKVLANVGFGSRRAIEQWIAAGKVSVNGETATIGMRVQDGDLIRLGRKSYRVGQQRNARCRILLYHKQEGEIVSRRDPEGRDCVFHKLPRIAGSKWIAIGRLDFNTSGLLIFTTSGELANRLMHPRFEVEREYAVRIQGELQPQQIDQVLTDGIMLEDGPITFEKLEDQGGEGFNHWYHIIVKEGRNRVIRRSFDVLGHPVSRLMRIRFGTIQLPPRLKRGQLIELNEQEVNQVLQWADVDLDDNPRHQTQTSRAGNKQPTSHRNKARRPSQPRRRQNRSPSRK